MSVAIGRNAIGGAGRKKSPYDAASGGYGVRQEFVNAGLKNEDIGFDGSWVTYKGNKMLQPKANVNGTTYADKGDIQNGISTAYRNNGQNLVRVNQYHNKYGLSAPAGWDAATKDVTVGGESIPYAYIDDDGNAWADESVLDAAYKRLAGRNGIQDADGMLSEYNKRVDAAEKSAQRSAEGLKNWSMTSDQMRRDAAFKAYEDLYLEEAARSYIDNLARTAGQNGGNLSSAALAAAGAGQRYHLSQMAAQIPQLYQNAYERYARGEAASIDNQREIAANALNRLNAEYEINRDRIGDYNNAQEAERVRQNDDMARRQWQQGFDQTAKENALINAQNRGHFTPEEAAQWGADVNASPYAGEAARALYVYLNSGKQIEEGGYDSQYKHLIEPQLTLQHNYAMDENNQKYENDVNLTSIENANKIALARLEGDAAMARTTAGIEADKYNAEQDRILKLTQTKAQYVQDGLNDYIKANAKELDRMSEEEQTAAIEKRRGILEGMADYMFGGA